jgi:hypothetical protein
LRSFRASGRFEAKLALRHLLTGGGQTLLTVGADADRILMIEDGWVHAVDKYEHRRKLLSSLKEG